MPYVSRPFNRYVLYYLSRHPNTFEAEIDCFNNNERAGIIYFFPDGAALPNNRDTVNGIYLYYHLHRFNDVITILREEKPLYLMFHTERLHGYIGTHYEPVGEEEGT